MKIRQILDTYFMPTMFFLLPGILIVTYPELVPLKYTNIIVGVLVIFEGVRLIQDNSGENK